MTDTRNVRFVHLTDLHLVHPDHPEAATKIDSLPHLDLAIATIEELQPRPDFVLVSGDITDFGDEASYRLAFERLSRLGAPVRYALGNHDKRAGFYKAFGIERAPSAAYDVDELIGDVHLITLDSLVPGEVAGRLDKEQIAFLEAALARHPAVAKVIMVHHPPRMDGLAAHASAALDAPSSKALADLVSNPPVAALICGHVHVDRVSVWKGLPVVTNRGLQLAADPTFGGGLRLIGSTGFALHELSGSQVQTHFVGLTPGAPVVKTILE